MQTVQLVRRSSRRWQRRDKHFFYLCYLPLNVALLYATLVALFPWTPVINERYQFEWYQSCGPEWWAVLHIILIAVTGYLGYTLSRMCFRPQRFLWLPLVLGMLVITLYG